MESDPGCEGYPIALQKSDAWGAAAAVEEAQMTWLTLHFRPVNRTASPGEVFLCALRPPSWRKHQASAPCRSSSLQAANREGSGRFPLSGPGYCPAAQHAAGEARPSRTAPPSSSRESPAPPARQKTQRARLLRSKNRWPREKY